MNFPPVKFCIRYFLISEVRLHFTHVLAFQIFDNDEYDCRTPEEWMSLGLEPGSHDRKPVPGKALLPTDDVLGHGKA